MAYSENNYRDNKWLWRARQEIRDGRFTRQFRNKSNALKQATAIRRHGFKVKVWRVVQPTECFHVQIIPPRS